MVILNFNYFYADLVIIFSWLRTTTTSIRLVFLTRGRTCKGLVNFEKWQHVKTFNVIGVEVWCVFVKSFRRYWQNKKTAFRELNFSPPYKDLRETYIKNAYFIYINVNFVHFFIVYKKKLILNPLFEEIWTLKKKKRGFMKFGETNFTAVEIGRKIWGRS